MQVIVAKRVRFLLIVALLLTVWCCGKSDESSQEDINFDQTIRKTTEFIEGGMQEHEIVGLSIALVSDDEVVWAEGFGWADKENEIPATPDTVYMLGSGSKTLTTAAVLQLYDQGKFSLDDPVTEHFPDFDLRERYPNQMQEITVRRLLNHHSGIPGDIYNSGFMEVGWDEWGCSLFADWFFNYLKEDYPSYFGGDLAIYSNSAFVTAGELALRVGGTEGETFNDYMARSLFQPIGMDHTSFKIIAENAAKGYISGQPLPPVEANCSFAATGGAFTTVQDIAKFIITIINGGVTAEGSRILESDTVAMMGHAEKTDLDVNSYFQPGLGLDTMDDPAMRYTGPAWAKNGSTGHFNSLMEMLSERKLGVIVLTNCDTAGGFVYTAARECLQNAVLDKFDLAPTAPEMPEYVSVSDPAAIVGKYVTTQGYDEIVNNGDGTLTWIVSAHSDSPQQKKLQFEENMFNVEGGTEKLVFSNLNWKGTDHFVMIQYGSSGSVRDDFVFGGHVVLILGEKTDIPSTPDAWKNRAGITYIVENISWNDRSWDMPFIKLHDKNGVLMVEHQAEMAVVAAQNDDLAFVMGLSNRKDSCVRVIEEQGTEKVIFGGGQGYDIGSVLAIAVDDEVAGNVEFHKTDWYRFEAQASGQNIVFQIANGGDDFVLRLFDETLDESNEQGQDSIEWTSQEGTWYLAISPTPDAAGDYTITVKD